MVKVKTNSVEIFVDDLKEEAQDDVLRALGVEKPEDGNLDVVPLHVVPILPNTTRAE